MSQQQINAIRLLPLAMGWLPRFVRFESGVILATMAPP
jgi:hypothetical protein